MKVGTFCYATNQGLGILAREFYINGIVTHPMILAHHSRENLYNEWYRTNNRTVITDLKSPRQKALMVEHCRSVDVMFFFETPFDWSLIPICKEHGVRTVMMPMYECMPRKWPHLPDHIINPSTLDQQYFPIGQHIPVPVDVPYRHRTRAEIFVHNAGHGGLRGRNGLAELLAAIPMVKSPAKFLIRSQEKIPHQPTPPHGDAVYEIGTVPYSQLFWHGDVFVFPEKFNGLSLPLQEAYASGMLVMASYRTPNTDYLPLEPLIPVERYRKACVGGAYTLFDEAIIRPEAIARTIDEWYGRDISEFSARGKVYADDHSWKKLRGVYAEVLNAVVSNPLSSL